MTDRGIPTPEYVAHAATVRKIAKASVDARGAMLVVAQTEVAKENEREVIRVVKDEAGVPIPRVVTLKSGRQMHIRLHVPGLGRHSLRPGNIAVVRPTPGQSA